MSRPGLILLDRDGVLNSMVVHPEHGTVDSPLNPDEVAIPPGVPESIKQLNDAGWSLAIVSNQPAAAKGKTTRDLLLQTHDRVLKEAERAGGKILSSYICFHRAEDGCDCRKPKIGLLRKAFEENPGADPARSWMVGDGVTDIEAGKKMGMKTAFIGPKKTDAYVVFEGRAIQPDLWVSGLAEFVKGIL